MAGALKNAGGLFAHQSEHATFQIVTPKATIRLTHGRLHQIAMRDPTDQFDLPDHLTWQMNMGVDHNDVSGDGSDMRCCRSLKRRKRGVMAWDSVRFQQALICSSKLLAGH